MSENGCQTPERLELYLDDGLEPDERARVEGHLSRCDACRRRLVGIHEARREETVTRRAPESWKRRAREIPRRRRTARRWQPALAAVLVLALGLAVYRAVDVARPARQAPDAERLRTPPASPTGPAALAPADGAVVTPGAIEFRWSEVERARRYTLTVLDAEGDVVFRAETREAHRTVDWGQEEAPRDGRSYFWYVTAQLTDGTSTDSEIRRLSLAPD